MHRQMRQIIYQCKKRHPKTINRMWLLDDVHLLLVRAMLNGSIFVGF